MNSEFDPGQNASAHSSQADWYLLFAAWLLASVATAVSLFLSEVMGMDPCPLCWYQRIFMYALVPVLLVGMHPFDPRVARYAGPLAVLGWLAALYHLLVYQGVIPEKMQPCGSDNSCAEADLVLSGLISIPTLSIITFSTIIVLLWLFTRRKIQ